MLFQIQMLWSFDENSGDHQTSAAIAVRVSDTTPRDKTPSNKTHLRQNPRYDKNPVRQKPLGWQKWSKPI